MAHLAVVVSSYSYLISTFSFSQSNQNLRSLFRIGELIQFTTQSGVTISLICSTITVIAGQEQFFIFVYWSSNVFSSLWIIMWLLISFYLFIFYLLSLVWFVCSFVTEPTSIGLNIGLDKARDHTSQLAEAEKPSEESGHSFGIPNTTLSLQKHSAYVKELKYGNSSYTACLSPVE